jgi:hypothetical protein
MKLIEKIKKRMAKRAQSSLQYDRRHEAFDKETDGWRSHKDPMMDRIQDDQN